MNPDSASAHATLSPSAAERWISCPASIRVEQEIMLEAVEAVSSPYALEGTAAHALAELRARAQINLSVPEKEFQAALVDWRAEHSIAPETEQEMLLHTDSYIVLLRELLARHPNSILLLEQRVPTGIPGCWGTADAVIVSPVHVEIVDFKYGVGVAVRAYDNPQIKLYGIGALETFGDLLGPVETVHMTIHQPRLDSISTHELPADELRAWRDSILPIAEEALTPDARFGPSEDACRWCDAKGRCRAQLEYATQLDFGRQDDLLSPQEMSEALEIIPAIEQWCSGVRAAALRLAYSEATPIPGFKVILSGGKRYVTDNEGAIRLLEQEGYSPDDVSTRKVFGIGALEKLLGKDRFQGILGGVIDKTPGNPALVPEDDKRVAISPEGEAAKEFSA